MTTTMSIISSHLFSGSIHTHLHHSKSSILKSQTLTLIKHHQNPRRFVSKTRAMGNGGDMLGDFGARDPFPAEIESGFGTKVLGNMNTEHKILIPNVTAFSLSQQDCQPVSDLQQPISEVDAQKLLRKVIGWRLINEGEGLRLQCIWKLKDFESGAELINRINKVTEAGGHLPSLQLEQPNQVRAELWTASIGGLSMNDFIVAAKIDQIQMSDLVPRRRVWA